MSLGNGGVKIFWIQTTSIILYYYNHFCDHYTNIIIHKINGHKNDYSSIIILYYFIFYNIVTGDQ